MEKNSNGLHHADADEKQSQGLFGQPINLELSDMAGDDLVSDQEYKEQAMKNEKKLAQPGYDRSITGILKKARLDYENKNNGVFELHNKPRILSSKTSLLCKFTAKNKLRLACAWVTNWRWFKHFILLAIVLNSILLTTTDYETRLSPSHESWWTPIQESLDVAFSLIFVIESVIKIIAMGFVVHKKSYLRDPWNCLDFFIVVISIIGMLPFSDGNESLKVLRTFRILRPLRSINKLKDLRLQIRTLLKAAPGILRDFLFIIFIFSIFAIFGTNQFIGQQYTFCRSQLDAVYDAEGEFLEWPKSGEADDEIRLCYTDQQCEDAYKNDEIAVCGSVYEKFGKDPKEYDGIHDIELIMYGIPGFDNIGQAFLTIFQTLTLESWIYLLYNHSDAGNPFIAITFFILVVLIGTFFTMNLVIASIVEAYQEVNEAANAEANQKEEDEEVIATLLKNQRLAGSLHINLKLSREIIERSSGLLAQSLHQRSDLRTMDEGNAFPSSMKTVEEIKVDPVDEKSDSEDKLEDFIHDKHLRSMNASQRNMLVDTKLSDNNVRPEMEMKTQEHDFDGIQTGRSLLSAPLTPLAQELADLSELEEQYEKDAHTRSNRNGLYRCSYALVTSVPFNFVIFLLIIGNTVTLSLYHFDQPDMQRDILIIFNEIFTWSFLLEMIVKLIGLGPNNYIKDRYNLFDAIIVIISLIDWAITRIPDLESGPLLNGFRALRLLRIFKLSKSIQAMREMLRKILQSMRDIGYFGLLLFLFMYIFALLGMDLFSNRALIDSHDDLVMGSEAIQALYKSGDYYTFPVDNFNNIGRALTTIFIVIIGEDWNWTMYTWVRAFSTDSSAFSFISTMYFLLVMILGNIIMFSLFTAILLRNFEGSDEEDEEEDLSFKDQLYEAFGGKIKRNKKVLNSHGKPHQDSKLIKPMTEEEKKHIHEKMLRKNAIGAVINNDIKQKDKAKNRKNTRRLIALFHYKELQQSMNKADIEKVKEKALPELEGNSLFCLGPENRFRLVVYNLVNKSWFMNFILLIITISTVTLAFENPLDNPHGDKIHILKLIDFVMTILFTIEVVLKVIAQGFVFGKKSYLRKAWNVLDFLIVVAALFDIIGGDEFNVGFLKSLRIMRVLRPLRLISRSNGLRISIISLGRAIPNIIRLIVIVFFFMFLLAILMTMLFSGYFASCHVDHLELNKSQQIQNIVTMFDCYNYGGEWVTPDFNFDTTVDSMLTLMSIQSTEGWIDVMFGTVDAVGPLYQPKEGTQLIFIPFMMILVILVCILFVELSVGVIIETFNSQKEILLGNHSLHRSQLAYARIHLLAVGMKPLKRFYAHTNKLRKMVIELTEHRYFEYFIMICILLNTFVLSFVWYMQDDEIRHIREKINYVFMGIFTIEAILKIISQKCEYFKNSWNNFDFVIVVATILILSLNWIGIGQEVSMLGTILLTLRTARVFRLIKKYQKLQEIYSTLLDAVPATASLGLLLMLFIFMFSIIGMSLFALVDVKDASEMNRHANFQSFGSSFLTLLRCATGEAWNSIMFDSSRHHTILFQCSEDETFDTIVADGRDPDDPLSPIGCGTAFSFLFHILFQLIVSQMFLNLFIAIMIDSFFGQSDLANMAVKLESLEDFQHLWAKYDPDATGFITIKDLKLLFGDLCLADPNRGGALINVKKRITKNNLFTYGFISDLGIPTYEGMKKVAFHDVLIKLCYKTVRRHFMRDAVSNMHHKAQVLRKLGFTVNEDALACLYEINVKGNSFDKQFKMLEKKINDSDAQADVVHQMAIAAQKIKRQDQLKVDTQLRITNGQMHGNEKSNNFEIYTTLQLGSAHQINEMIIEYLSRTQKQHRF